MPTIEKPRRHTSSLFIHVLIVVFGLIGGYLYYSQIITANQEPIVLPDIKTDDQLAKFKDMRSFDFKIFSDESFRSLKVLGEVPVRPASESKDDLFAPF